MPEGTKRRNLSERIREFARQPWFISVLGVLVLLLLTGAGVGIWSTQQPPPQPIQFHHQRHVDMGVQCLYCHPGAWKQESAGLPTNTKCWGCHQNFPITKPEQQKLADYVARGEEIPWGPVFIQPDFVHFNLRPHIAAGVSCETCHGEISQQTVAQPRKGMNMGWCLECHRTRAAGDPEKLTRLTDCVICHR